MRRGGPVGGSRPGVAAQLPRHRGGRPAYHRADLPERASLGAQYCDLLTLSEGQTPALQITAAPGPDAARLNQNTAPGTPARIDQSHSLGNEVTRLHPGP